MVLPYEHKGATAAYSTGDWKDYLPVAAGGRTGANHSQRPAHVVLDPVSQTRGQEQGQQLGSIHYIRDSEDDGGLHDSDEDPDDDLDL